jgi:hypothetical protein
VAYLAAAKDSACSSGGDECRKEEDSSGWFDHVEDLWNCEMLICKDSLIGTEYLGASELMKMLIVIVRLVDK